MLFQQSKPPIRKTFKELYVIKGQGPLFSGYCGVHTPSQFHDVSDSREGYLGRERQANGLKGRTVSPDRLMFI